MQNKIVDVIEEVKKVVVGKDDIIEKVAMVILCGGHILLEDIPGVGKTTMALAFSKAMNLDYKRIQFTPDVMPTDVVGFSAYNKQKGCFEYQPGAVMCNLFLADEINRTSSKTQSALLESMEEGRVTVDGVTRELPKPYTVIATQNPMGFAGTQMLPESQLDRFMVRLSMGYPDVDDEVIILMRRQKQNPLESVNQVIDDYEILTAQAMVDSVYISNEIYTYIANISAKSREHDLVKLGISPRGSIAVAKMARACAWLNGRDFVIPKDIAVVANDTLSHRIILSSVAKAEGKDCHQVLDEIIKDVSVPEIVK